MRRHKARKARILAIASGGGHWIQLMRLRPAFKDADVIYASVHKGRPEDVGEAPYVCFRDANRDTKISLLFMAFRILLILLWYRPTRVVSTGAACGYFACRFGRWFGARTLFIDSIANAEQMSLSGRLALDHAHQVLSQWSDVAHREGALFKGSVL